MNKRTDYGAKADGWFTALDDSIAPLAADLRSLIRKAAPDATECIKWGTPNYEKKWTHLFGSCGERICGTPVWTSWDESQGSRWVARRQRQSHATRKNPIEE